VSTASTRAVVPDLTAPVRSLRLSVYSLETLLALVGGRLRPDLLRGGRGSPLSLEETVPPVRPPGWVRIRPTLAGVCASDRKILSLTGSGRTILSLYGMPSAIVPGHEIVGTVVDADEDSGFVSGQRVVAEPTLSCADKGLEVCATCAEGNDHMCERVPVSGALDAGQGFGSNARFGGGWSEALVAPARRVFPVPEHLHDRDAVLAEPLAIAVQAVASAPPPRGSRVLIIGPGTLGMCTLLALRALTPDVEVTVAGIHHFADPIATRLGADHLVHGTRDHLVGAAAELLATPVEGGRLSGPILARGFDAIYDCVGSTQTIDDALRMTRPLGGITLIGTANVQRADWTLVWSRSLTIRGTLYYGDIDVDGRAVLPTGRRRAMEVALDIAERERPGDLVTHIFPLSEVVEALRTAAEGPAAGALRVAFSPDA
jgi:threonine dehydrogenase-like Zn-dependent dehydrogenase